MEMFLFIAVAAMLVLGAIGYIAERHSTSADKSAGLALLPGDMKYESPSGNFRFYFPITTSIVLSLVLSLLLRFLG